jgi:hypothetical protein
LVCSFNFPPPGSKSRGTEQLAAPVISILCVTGIWIIAFFRWRYHARKVSRSSSVGLLDLLSINGAGEALDALRNLAWTRSPWRHLGLVAQCFFVGLLSIVGILAGPIARYSTGSTHVVGKTDVLGLMATNDHRSISSAMVKWNMTVNRLTSANFPQTQLLDFLPDIQTDWQYDSTEWNSSWAMSCEYTPLTPISVYATGNITDNFIDEIPGIRNAYPEGVSKKLEPIRVSHSYKGFFANSKVYKDLLMFTVMSDSPSTSSLDTARTRYNNETMRIVLIAFHFHNMPQSASDDAYFGVGPVETSAYTRAECTLSRNSVQDAGHIAYPWTNDTSAIATAFSSFHQANMVEQSIADAAIYHPTGTDLVRFYQAYIVTKDTQYKHVVNREISVLQPRVEIAAIALVAFLLYAVILIVLLVWSFAVYHVPKGLFVPRTKFEWVMEAVRETVAHKTDWSKFEASEEELRKDLNDSTYGTVSSVAGWQHVGIGCMSTAPAESDREQVQVHATAIGQHNVWSETIPWKT